MWPLNICVKNSEEARKMFKSHPKNEKEVGNSCFPQNYGKNVPKKHPLITINFKCPLKL